MGLQWENLALYSLKPAEIQENGNPFGSYSYSPNPIDGSGQILSHDDFWKFSPLPLHASANENASDSEASFLSGESVSIGLKLGRQKERGDNLSKRSRTFYHNTQSPCCQVEGCNLDLKLAKDYHRRHRICEGHSKSPKVVVAGMERRFCQQCSRLHELSEFDDKKRSCRRRLSDHNARRRRVPPESTQMSSAGLLSSALYDRRPQHVLFNPLPIPVSGQTWESDAAFKARFGCNESTVPSVHYNSNRLSIIQSQSPKNLDQCSHAPPIGPDFPNAHSLLSSNFWGLNEAIPSSLEGLPMGSYGSERNQGQHNWAAVFHPAEQRRIDAAQLQEFQSLNASFDSSCYYSNQRNS